MWNEKEKKPILRYIILTFLIAWISEVLLILGERLGILTCTAEVVVLRDVIIRYGGNARQRLYHYVDSGFTACNLGVCVAAES